MMRHCRLDDRHPNDTFVAMEADHVYNRCELVMDVHIDPLVCCPVDARYDTCAQETHMCANFADHVCVAYRFPAPTF